MEKTTFPNLNEELFHSRLINGLNVFILPKKSFNKTHVTLTTNYGGADGLLIPSNSKRDSSMPDGIAHFLEHLILNTEKGPVNHIFSKQGALSNAFTTSKQTTYLFTTVLNIEENIETLLDTIQDPVFSDNMIKNEIGIINQEISMYNDNPDWIAYFATIENLFVNHPVKISLTGTQESIKDITKSDLYTIHSSFYHPENMVLFIVGDVDPDKTLLLIKKNQDNKSFKENYNNKILKIDEPKKVKYKSRKIKMPIKTPKVYLGYKEADMELKGEKLIKYELLVNILLDLMFGKSSKTYEKLYNRGLVDESFGYIYISEPGFGFTLIGGDSYSPNECVEILEYTINEYKSELLDEQEANRAIKKRIGLHLQEINSTSYIAHNFSRFYFNEVNLFNILSILESLTVKDLEKVLTKHFIDDCKTTLIIEGE